MRDFDINHPCYKFSHFVWEVAAKRLPSFKMLKHFDGPPTRSLIVRVLNSDVAEAEKDLIERQAELAALESRDESEWMAVFDKEMAEADEDQERDRKSPEFLAALKKWAPHDFQAAGLQDALCSILCSGVKRGYLRTHAPTQSPAVFKSYTTLEARIAVDRAKTSLELARRSREDMLRWISEVEKFAPLPELAVYKITEDYFIAYSEEDAKYMWHENTGLTFEDGNEIKRIPDDHVFSVLVNGKGELDEDGREGQVTAAKLIEMQARATVSSGRGYLFAEDGA